MKKIINVSLVCVVVFAFAFMAMGSGSSSNSTESNSSTTTTDKAADSKNTTLTVGNSIDVDGLKISFDNSSTNFTDYKDEYGLYKPDSGMKYVKATFTFTNNSGSDKYVSIYDFDCYADGTLCNSQYGLDDNDFMATTLSNGRNVSFSVYFQVPENASSIELEYETNIWTDAKLIVKLQ